MVPASKRPRDELRREDLEISPHPTRRDLRQYDTGRLGGTIYVFVTMERGNLLRC